MIIVQCFGYSDEEFGEVSQEMKKVLTEPRLDRNCFMYNAPGKFVYFPKPGERLVLIMVTDSEDLGGQYVARILTKGIPGLLVAYATLTGYQISL